VIKAWRHMRFEKKVVLQLVNHIHTRTQKNQFVTLKATWTAACMSEVLSFASQMDVTASLTNLLRFTFRNSSISPSLCSSFICFNFLITAVLRLMLESNVLRNPESGDSGKLYQYPLLQSRIMIKLHFFFKHSSVQ